MSIDSINVLYFSLVPCWFNVDILGSIRQTFDYLIFMLIFLGSVSFRKKENWALAW